MTIKEKIMKKIIVLIVSLFFSIAVNASQSSGIFNVKRNPQTGNVMIVKQMFSKFAEHRDMNKFDTYYSKDFVLDSNGKTYSYAQYKALEANIYKTLASLKVLRYDDIFSSQNKVAARMFIRLVNKAGQVNVFQVILIAEIKNNKISHIWEITYPNWSDRVKVNK